MFSSSFSTSLNSQQTSLDVSYQKIPDWLICRRQIPPNWLQLLKGTFCRTPSHCLCSSLISHSLWYYSIVVLSISLESISLAFASLFHSVFILSVSVSFLICLSTCIYLSIYISLVYLSIYLHRFSLFLYMPWIFLLFISLLVSHWSVFHTPQESSPRRFSCIGTDWMNRQHLFLSLLLIWEVVWFLQQVFM